MTAKGSLRNKQPSLSIITSPYNDWSQAFKLPLHTRVSVGAQPSGGSTPWINSALNLQRPAGTCQSDVFHSFQLLFHVVSDYIKGFALLNSTCLFSNFLLFYNFKCFISHNLSQFPLPPPIPPSPKIQTLSTDVR